MKDLHNLHSPRSVTETGILTYTSVCQHTMEGEEALKNYCRRMISHVRRKQQHPVSQALVGRGRHLLGRQTEVDQPLLLPEVPNSKLDRYIYIESNPPASSPGLQSQGPAVQLVPQQLISLLRHKTFKSEMQRAAEVNQHDPSVCSVCVAEQASLALDAFIRRKTTQIDSRRLEARLNMHLCNWDSVCLLGELARSLPKPSDAPHRIWEELIGRDRRVTATWGCHDYESGK